MPAEPTTTTHAAHAAELPARPCVVCRTPFCPLRPTHLTCGAACRARYDLDALAQVAGVAAPADQDPWMLAAPARRLPPLAVEFEVTVPGADDGLYAPGNATLMHGVMTALLDLGHTKSARFTAFPNTFLGDRWILRVHPDDVRGQLAGPGADARRVHRIQVGRSVRQVVVTRTRTIAAPAPEGSPGRRRLLIMTQSPVVIRAGGGGGAGGQSAGQGAAARDGAREEHRTRTAPDAGNLASALSTTMLARLGWPERIRDVVPVTILEADTTPRAVALRDATRRGERVGGDGILRGWEGSVHVETSAMGAWLLEVAEVFGLGGRVAYGFGRVQVYPETGEGRRR